MADWITNFPAIEREHRYCGARRMLKAVLLDLDNTMVIFDEPLFYQHYIAAAYRSFSDIMSEDEFSKHLLSAIATLRHNNGDMDNLAYFLEAFRDGKNIDNETIWQRFNHFYNTVYDTLPVRVSTPSGLKRTLDRLRQMNLTLVVATNPIFPLYVQLKRLTWAKIDKVPFDLITHIQNMSFVKPNLGYYREICTKIGLSPGHCLMVGNDPVNDIIAGKAGLKTYLTTDAAEVNYSSLTQTSKASTTANGADMPDFTGAFARIIDVVENLV
jgi:FMN phosphatase YigB (HAD superfamily)